MRALFLGYMDAIAGAIAAHAGVELRVFLERQRARSDGARERLQARGVPVVVMDRLASCASFHDGLRAGTDLIFVGGFGQILPREIIDAPAHGVVNVHPSYLPDYRGGWPIEWHILNQESRGGVTLHWIDEGVDTGPIITQARFPIGDRDRYDDVYHRAESAGAGLVTDLLNRPVASWPRHPQGTSTRKALPRSAGLGVVNWRRPAREIDRLVRAEGWKGWVRCELPAGPLVLSRAVPEETPAATAPGTVLEAGEQVRVATGDGVLRVETWTAPEPLTVGQVLPSGPEPAA